MDPRPLDAKHRSQAPHRRENRRPRDRPPQSVPRSPPECGLVAASPIPPPPQPTTNQEPQLQRPPWRCPVPPPSTRLTRTRPWALPHGSMGEVAEAPPNTSAPPPTVPPLPSPMTATMPTSTTTTTTTMRRGRWLVVTPLTRLQPLPRLRLRRLSGSAVRGRGGATPAPRRARQEAPPPRRQAKTTAPPASTRRRGKGRPAPPVVARRSPWWSAPWRCGVG